MLASEPFCFGGCGSTTGARQPGADDGISGWLQVPGVGFDRGLRLGWETLCSWSMPLNNSLRILSYRDITVSIF